MVFRCAGAASKFVRMEIVDFWQCTLGQLDSPIGCWIADFGIHRILWYGNRRLLAVYTSPTGLANRINVGSLIWEYIVTVSGLRIF